MSTNTTPTLLRQLEACVQEEIGGQARLLALLETQETALRGHRPDELLAATRALDGEVELAAKRGARRGELVAELARQWGLAHEALTLSSIVRRSGGEGGRLARQKEDLERVSRQVQRLARRTATAARYYERLNSELLHVLLTPEGGPRLAEGGALVDAEA
jgi:hypothetical protein